MSPRPPGGCSATPPPTRTIAPTTALSIARTVPSSPPRSALHCLMHCSKPKRPAFILNRQCNREISIDIRYRKLLKFFHDEKEMQMKNILIALAIVLISTGACVAFVCNAHNATCSGNSNFYVTTGSCPSTHTKNSNATFTNGQCADIGACTYTCNGP